MIKPYYQEENLSIYLGDCLSVLKELAPESINCVVTSPPYWGLRDYGIEGQIGLEPTPEEYVSKMVEIFREIKRVLRNDGTVWLNLGDSYSGSGKGGNPEMSKWRYMGSNERKNASMVNQGNIPQGLKPKDLVGIPWRVAFALQADGWYLRSDIIWAKPNPMPESVRDRPTKSHEYIFLLAKSEKYYFDQEAISEKSEYGPGCGWDDAGHEISVKTINSKNPAFRAIKLTRNKRSVWNITTQPFPEAHFATFPPKLIEPCILAGCPKGGTVLDPFAGAGTTLLVSKELNRKAIGIELNKDYCEIGIKRLRQEVLKF